MLLQGKQVPYSFQIRAFYTKHKTPCYTVSESNEGVFIHQNDKARQEKSFFKDYIVPQTKRSKR